MRIQSFEGHRRRDHELRHDVMRAGSLLTVLIMLFLAYLWYAAAHYTVQYNPAYGNARIAGASPSSAATRDAVLRQDLPDEQ